MIALIRRHPRAALVAIYAVSTLGVGIGTDLLTFQHTDLLRDPFSTLMTLVVGAMLGDVTVNLWLHWQEVLAPRARLVRGLALSFLTVWGAHALLPLTAMLVQIPRADFAMMTTIVLGMEWLLRHSLLPAVVFGALAGFTAAAVVQLLGESPQADGT